MITEEHKDWIGVSASDQSCYKWPDDTELHRQCRAAYVAGATDYSRPDRIEALEAALREIVELANTLTHTTCSTCRMAGAVARAALDKDAK